MIFYARHRQTVETEVIIKITANTKKEAEKLNEDWCIGTKNPKVKPINKETEERDYSASHLREENNFYE